ncbi:hypothetical protein [Erwinia phage vB_Ea277G]|nr:hypothetical protein [Erwinia phage vB_Ea277G]
MRLPIALGDSSDGVFIMEANLLGGQKRSKVVVDIDFEDAVVGSQVLTSKSGNFTFGRKQGSGTVNGTDGVVDDPTYGKCYRFNGITYFEDPTGRPGIWNKEYRITLVFQSLAAKAEAVFGTGDYNPTANIGSSLSINNYASQWVQYFMCNGQYQRVLLNGTRPTVMETIIITRRSTGVTIESPRTGQKNSYPDFNTLGETFFRIGVAQNPAYCFTGLMKSLKIELL